MSTAVKDAPKTEEMSVFQLMEGCHEDTDPNWTRPIDKETGKPIMKDPETGIPILPKSHMYRWNEEGNNIVRSHRDLVRELGPKKFMRLTGDGSVIDQAASAANQVLLQTNANLDAKLQAALKELEQFKNPGPDKIGTGTGLESKSLAELKFFCDEQKIDTKGLKTKDDFLAAAQLHVAQSK